MQYVSETPADLVIPTMRTATHHSMARIMPARTAFYQRRTQS